MIENFGKRDEKKEESAVEALKKNLLIEDSIASSHNTEVFKLAILELDARLKKLEEGK